MNNNLDETLKPSRVTNVLVASEDETMMLLKEGSEHAFMLNHTSQLIWQLSDGNTSIGEIIGLLENAFSEEGSDIRGDVLDALDRLQSAGLLTLN